MLRSLLIILISFASWLTVSADSDQTQAPLRIVIIGNSIVRHPPASELGWYGDWGMAASREDMDFVHVFAGMMESASGRDVELRYPTTLEFEFNYAHYDLQDLKDYRDFNADIIIIRLGDNVTGTAGYEHAFTELVNYLRLSETQVMVCTSSWFPKPEIDKIQRRVCQAAGARFADISHLFTEVENRASSERDFSSNAVGSHPGDKGMAEIARILFDTTYPRHYLPLIHLQP